MFNLDKYKDIHKGETCYIFGDGPSIKWFDLSKFSDYIGISCGVIPFHNDFEKLNVKYHMLVEPWFYCPSWMQPHQYLKDYKPLSYAMAETMKKYKDKEFFINLSNFPWKMGKNINYVHEKMINKKNKLYEIKQKENPFSGSFQATLSLAYLMGFTKVYLIGFDGWTIQPARAKRWYEYGEGEYFIPTNFATDFLHILKSQMQIFTISLDGESCNVNNISYRKFSNQQPIFKENNLLLKDEYLKILDSFPEYEIYTKDIVYDDKVIKNNI